MDDINLAGIPEFELAVEHAVDWAMKCMPEETPNEVRLRYVTHIFAQVLDSLSEKLTQPIRPN